MFTNEIYIHCYIARISGAVYRNLSFQAPEGRWNLYSSVFLPKNAAVREIATAALAMTQGGEIATVASLPRNDMKESVVVGKGFPGYFLHMEGGFAHIGGDPIALSGLRIGDGSAGVADACIGAFMADARKP